MPPLLENALRTNQFQQESPTLTLNEGIWGVFRPQSPQPCTSNAEANLQVMNLGNLDVITMVPYDGYH